METLPFFEWLDTSLLASIAKSNGGVFAVVQMFHLLGMATLGGMVLLGDLRLLGILMRDIPSATVIDNTHRWFGYGLALTLISGIFMASAVAMKLYYNEAFWAKMTGLGIGILFVYCVRRPLLSFEHSSINPWAMRCLAGTSMVLWFTVAASGRWIGFS